MPDELKPVLRRQMEIYAGYLEYADHHVGRLVDALDGLDVLDDTLVYYILGDNGASAEGTLQGGFNEILHLNGMSHSRPPNSCASASTIRRTDVLQPLFGRLGARDEHALPGGQAGRLALGGTRNGAIVHGPMASRPRARSATSFIT